ncbi:hypothetical protein OCU04_007894 [Sclerotinia nivalis]|uniref:Uncharacterized protein n=1 Tax=Sclerotinia nivalis TaxID=352851 RepID=A0A9X0DID7_9HELO|nr:hypothetical protein OCU04_007894 [Sclerotinia nivalis]
MSRTYYLQSKDLSNTRLSLSDDVDAICIFTTSIGEIQSQNQLVLKPFRRQVNFTYHEYEIFSSLTRDLKQETIDSMKELIVKQGQEIYDHCFQGTPYNFVFKKAEVSISEKRKNQHEHSNPMNPQKRRKYQAHHESTPHEQEHPPLSQKNSLGHHGNPTVSVLHKKRNLLGHQNNPRVSIPHKEKNQPDHKDDLKDVQESYRKGYRSGKLQKLPGEDKTPPPVFASSWDTSETWSPYIIKHAKKISTYTRRS